MARIGAPALDLSTRLWWRATGRPVDLGGAQAWLEAPISPRPTVGRAWVDDVSGLRPAPRAGAGLLSSFDDLAGPGFDPSRVDPRIRAFYEHTGDWQIEVRSQWAPLFRPGGALVAALFGRRVQQLALPVDPRATAQGMSSEVVPLLDTEGRQRAAAWVRTLRSTGETVFSGCYATAHLPGDLQPVVHVSFPLEQGNVQVFLRPVAHPDGSLTLVSGKGAFGEPGAYVVVVVGGQHHAARVTLHESFHLYVDEEGVLRTDHTLRLGPATAVRLHYRLTPHLG